ncbi:MAG: HD-GYP domain-containing protein [Candidatus Gastranaerophilales bacterium]|nr:HD-GYP domain-containing protein [Candidatus Gastranaerophilales bacterium]
MELVYNIDFELAGLLFTSVFYVHFCLYYSNQTEVNKKFRTLIKYLMLAELMDIVTAVTITYGSVIPVALNMLANTAYFLSTFCLAYTFVQYVESCVSSNESKKTVLSVNKFLLIAQCILLFLNLFTGYIFGFDQNGTYTHGSLYLLVYIVPVYYILCSAYILFKNRKQFRKKQFFSIIAYIVLCILGPVLQMLWFPDVLLSVFTCSIAAVIILFAMETPDYQMLTKTLAELEDLRKSLQKEVKRQTKAAEDRREKLEHLSEQVILTLAKTIDAKDKYTKGHSERVADYSRKIAARLDLSEQEQQDIYWMGLLHDIGKIGIPDTIINKTGKLTDEEYKVIQQHPVIGVDILNTISDIPHIADGTRSHHEKYDGTGYPDGLSGENIPFVARIIGVADAYDAMTSKRSYRDVLPQEVVRAEIVKGRGTQFDPQCADIMLAMMDEDKEYQMKEH